MQNAGAAYAFVFNGTAWVEQQKLIPSDLAAGDSFGFSVDRDGDGALIGSRLDDDNGLDAGSAYVFEFDGSAWNQGQKLLARNGAAGDQFGYASLLAGPRVLIGARQHDGSGMNAGAAYVFDRDRSTGLWSEAELLLPGGGQEGDQFGISLGFTTSAAVVGAWLDDDHDVNAGSAYVFNAPFGCDCNANGITDRCDLQDGTSLDANANGVPDECERACGDFNLDGCVGPADLAMLLNNWGPCGNCNNCPADLNSDCVVGPADLAQLRGNWGCPSPCIQALLACDG